MKRFILTGTPGSGKTSLIRMLDVKGFCVVEEAATDVISAEQVAGNKEPWTHSSFIDKITLLQNKRQKSASVNSAEVQFYDRSPFCTYALAIYLNFPISEILLNEIKRIENENIYQKQVFFIENLGFIEETSARKIKYEQALVFEKIHKNVYQKFNYELIKISPENIKERFDKIIQISYENKV